MAAFTSLGLLLSFFLLGSLGSDLPLLTPAAATLDSLYFFSRLGSKYHHKEVHITAKNLFENTTRHPITIIKTDKFIAITYPSPSPVASPVMLPFLSAHVLSVLGRELGVGFFMSGAGSCGYKHDEERGADSMLRRLRTYLLVKINRFQQLEAPRIQLRGGATRLRWLVPGSSLLLRFPDRSLVLWAALFLAFWHSLRGLLCEKFVKLSALFGSSDVNQVPAYKNWLAWGTKVPFSDSNPRSNFLTATSSLSTENIY